MANTIIKQHVPVFISSTYEDLIPYRDEVQRVLVRLEQIIKGMEYFGSSPESSLDVCLKQVRESKIFISIIGMRYGSINDDTGLSFSQLEYEEAIKNSIPTLIYIIDENHPIAPKYVDIGEKAKKLIDFKDYLKKKHTVSFFTTPNDLGEKISHDLVETLSSFWQIEAEQKDNTMIENDILSIIDRFRLRPAKYYGQEVQLRMRILEDLKGSTLKDELVLNLGLSLGDTVAVDVIVVDSKNKAINRPISLYADGENADWLENIAKGSIIEAKVRLSFCTIKEINKYDGGTILRNSTYLGFIVINGLSIEGQNKVG
ncbi:hypothetical protein CLHUN_37760 [Ruminiclostridium hungatei]|uniref:DUF4062 domain-containing protein n=1 Tax=Ruminiclostridium hungatei TaxID=48256 RepID=A0A1V4SGF9_RUMHU|nr:DUF4062 domain-containing protein [Ruminiclostridium hungatei]OPX42357.1 hypothetical protein CLHUN_37760 [Ruminiclostridium hungatei]